MVGTQLGSTTMTYDSFGRLTTLTDDERRGGTTTTSTYGFDALNRVSSESFPSGQSNTYAYTLNSQLYTLTTTGGTTTYGYDAIDRVTSITDPSSAVVRYGYDDGTTGGTPRTITTTMPGGATTTTSLNQSGRLTSDGTTSATERMTSSRNSAAPLASHSARSRTSDPRATLAMPGTTTGDWPRVCLHGRRRRSELLRVRADDQLSRVCRLVPRPDRFGGPARFGFGVLLLSMPGAGRVRVSSLCSSSLRRWWRQPCTQSRGDSDRDSRRMGRRRG